MTAQHTQISLAFMLVHWAQIDTASAWRGYKPSWCLCQLYVMMDVVGWQAKKICIEFL